MTITNLAAKFRYPTHLGSNRPVAILMHGFNQDASDFADATLLRLSQYGLFVLAVGMRGRDSADGTPDVSAREIHDIIDALTYVRTTEPYSLYASPTRAGIIGYSGGGGNVLAAACKFPDAFEIVVSHFGISDYGYDGTYGWYQDGATGADQATLVSWIGGTPAAVPNAYRARNAIDAIANYSGGHLYLYHDEDDTDVPIHNSERVGAAMLAASRANYSESYTSAVDDPRWTHELPNGSAAVIATEATWAAALADGTHAAWTVPATGTMTVIGYMVTKRFSIWLGSTVEAGGGLDEVATVVYNTTTGQYTVTPLTGACDVFIKQGALTASQAGVESETLLTVA